MKNSNLYGGDINGGAFNLRRILFGTFKPLNPYKLPIPGFYICSSSTPPGPGVHGICAFNAAAAALASKGNKGNILQAGIKLAWGLSLKFYSLSIPSSIGQVGLVFLLSQSLINFLRFFSICLSSFNLS